MVSSQTRQRAWVSARETMTHAPDVLAQPDVLDKLIIWRMNDPRYEDRQTRVKGLAMQRQWTIEARADYADQDKNDAITEAIRRAAVHVHATMVLLSDGQRPQVVAFSDDFFTGHEDISLQKDTLGEAIAQEEVGEEAPVSEEMLAALRELPSNKPDAK